MSRYQPRGVVTYRPPNGVGGVGEADQERHLSQLPSEGADVGVFWNGATSCGKAGQLTLLEILGTSAVHMEDAADMCPACLLAEHGKNDSRIFGR